MNTSLYLPLNTSQCVTNQSLNVLKAAEHVLLSMSVKNNKITVNLLTFIYKCDLIDSVVSLQPIKKATDLLTY